MKVAEWSKGDDTLIQSVVLTPSGEDLHQTEFISGAEATALIKEAMKHVGYGGILRMIEDERGAYGYDTIQFRYEMWDCDFESYSEYMAD